MIDKDVEVGKIFVDTEKSHVGAGGAPIGHEELFNSSSTERRDETVSGCEIGNSGAMQRERRAQQGGNAALDHGKVAKPHGVQLQRHFAWRGSFRLLRSPAVDSIGRESQKMRRDGRSGFSG